MLHTIFHSFILTRAWAAIVRRSETLIFRKCLDLKYSFCHNSSRRVSVCTSLFSPEKPHSCSSMSQPNNKTNHSAAAKCQVLKQETIHREKWLSLQRVTYSDPTGRERTWEVAERTTKSKAEGMSDCVAMVAILNRLLHYDCIVLVKQFRPPLKAYSIEFPAGLVDPGETLEQAALRELKEETGYTGTVLAVSPCTALDPGMSSASCCFVHVQIDGNDTGNAHPHAAMGEGEFTEVLLIPVNEMLHRLQELAKQKDVVIDAQVYMYASTLRFPHLGMVSTTVTSSG